MMMLGTCDI